MANQDIEITFKINGIEKTVGSVKEFQKEMEKAGQSSKKLASEQGFIAEKVEDLKRTFGGLKGDFQNLTSGISTFFKSGTTGAKLLKIGLASLGIPALIALVAGLINYFKNFEVVTKVVDTALNSLGAVFGQLGKSISALLKGDFSGAKDAFLGIGEAVKEAAENTDQLYTAQKRLNELQQRNAVQNAKLRQEIEGYKKILEDTTKTEAQRLAALNEVTKRTKQLANAQLEENAAAIKGLEAKIALEQNEVARRDLQLELAQLQAERIDQQTELNNVEYDALKVGREIRQATADAVAAEKAKKDEADAKAREEAEAKAQEEAQKEVERKKALNEQLRLLDEEALIAATTNEFDRARQELDIQQQRDLEALAQLGATEEEKKKIYDKYAGLRKKTDEEEAEFKKKVAEEELNGKLQVASAAFDAISSLVGENSAAGKAAAVASATINTYQAATNALANTPLPPPFPQIAAGVAIASGLMNVKQILSTKVPGDKGGGAGTVPAVPRGRAFDPSAAIANSQAGGGAGAIAGIEQGGSQQAPVIRAYVVATEVSSQQEANKKVNDLSKL